jgi:hypothetical protein
MSIDLEMAANILEKSTGVLFLTGAGMPTTHDADPRRKGASDSNVRSKGPSEGKEAKAALYTGPSTKKRIKYVHSW